MEESLFIQYVNKYFTAITLSVVEKLNDTKNPLTYLHRRMLRKEYSVSGKWDAISVSNSLVMADVVAMDSELPLKKRDSISKASGDIPKMGMEMKLNETQLTQLQTIVRQGGQENQILSRLFNDTPKVIGGVYERNEAMFLQALSTGITLVNDDENTGTGVRIDFGYKTENKFGVTTLWSNTASTPFDDLNRVKEKARLDGNVIIKFMVDQTTINYILATTQAKELYAFSVGFVGSQIPTPDITMINRMTQARYEYVFEVVERSVRYEKNGQQTAYKPWSTQFVIGLSEDQVGVLQWARLAEQDAPVSGVTYSTVEEFILVSKYRSNKPLTEWTSSQARVVPIIANVDRIYQLDRTTIQA